MLLAFQGFGQSAYTINAHVKRVIDSTYNALLKKNQVVGASIAIVDHGEIVYATGYGFADKVNLVKADEKTVYRIGSCTKAFTSLAIMQLQEKGLLNVNSSVKTYLPELTIGSRFNDNNQILIGDMLCHVSGLPCDIANGFFCDAPPDMAWVINELNKQTTISPRLFKHAYSNVAYGLLGEVIARTAKTTYSDYVKNSIFTPLQMTSSFIDYDAKLAAGFSKAYVNNKEIKEPIVRDQGAGLIHSNALDMANYLKLYLGRGTYNGTQLVSAETMEEMEKNRLGNTLLSKNSNWGYGLYSKTMLVCDSKDSTVAHIIGHGGDTYAFHADFGYMPEMNVGVVILTNTDKGVYINSADFLLKLYLKEAKGKTVVMKFKAATTVDNESACTAEDIKGNFMFGPMIMKAGSVKKMSFKQGPAKIVLHQKKADPLNYSLKAIVFGIVPVKVKNQEITFVKVNDVVYLKAISTKSKKTDYLAVKTNNGPIPDAWKKKAGTYKAIGKSYPCTGCPYGNTEGMTISLGIKDGFMHMGTKAKTEDMTDSFYLDILSDSMAITGGLGRGTGNTVRLLKNGNIYYSGFEFARVN
jgi:CubicO group peptidase (beta-lactamase class C family)